MLQATTEVKCAPKADRGAKPQCVSAPFNQLIRKAYIIPLVYHPFFEKKHPKGCFFQSPKLIPISLATLIMG